MILWEENMPARATVNRVCLSLAITHRRYEHGLMPRYPIEAAGWIWHPGDPDGVPLICRFQVDFEVPEDVRPCRFHVSADQQYELFLDGERIPHGPESGDIEHWPFASFEVTGLRGTYRLEGSVCWAGEHAPTQRLTVRKGFILESAGKTSHAAKALLFAALLQQMGESTSAIRLARSALSVSDAPRLVWQQAKSRIADGAYLSLLFRF